MGASPFSVNGSRYQPKRVQVLEVKGINSRRNRSPNIMIQTGKLIDENQMPFTLQQDKVTAPSETLIKIQPTELVNLILP